jgi:hypothetical protein
LARALARAAYVIACLALAGVWYEFLGAGPTPSEKPDTIAWWRPAGHALRLESEWLAPLQEIAADVEQARHDGRVEPRGLIPFLLFALPPAALAALGFLLFRGAVARVLILGLGLALCAFSYYGWLDPETWQDFSWRWPAVLLSTALFVALFALLPWLVRSARRLPLALQLAGGALFVLAIYFLSVEVTGTNPALQWNLSPWPTLTLYGFLLAGLVLAVVEVAAGVGLLARGAGGAGRTALAAAAAALLAAALHRIPFSTTGAVQLAAVALPAAFLAVVAARRPGAPRALDFVSAGLLVLGAVELGRWQGERFLAQSRDQIAPRVTAALERFREENGAYPSELEQIVPRYLPEIPLPRAGWLDSKDETFLYTYLGGDNFLLEFPGVVWVQCAYSPPYEELAEDEDEEGVAAGGEVAGAPPRESESLEASWSCESKPPRLW